MLFNKTKQTRTAMPKKIWNSEKFGLFIALHFKNRKRWNKTCRFTKSLRKSQEKHWKPLMLLRFHVGTQTGRSQTWRWKRKSPEVHTKTKNPKKITEYSKQDFNQKCGINSKARGNKPIPTPLSSPHPRPHSRQRAGLDMVPIYLILFLPQAQGNSWPAVMLRTLF